MTLTIVVAVLITVAMLGAGGLMTTVGPWYREVLRKPSWNPPDWLFGPAWTVILGLAAWAGVLAWTNAPDGEAHTVIIAVYTANILCHLAWSPIFFNLRRPDWALIEVIFLWGSVVALMIELPPYAPLAFWLVLPYLLWVSFAAYLNFVIVRINPPFSRANRA